MKANIAEQEYLTLAAIPKMAAGATLLEVMKRERDAELTHALNCVRGRGDDLAMKSLQRAAVIAELIDFLAVTAPDVATRTVR
ncbi:MAG: hypothetical protein KGZ68_04370 [Dechloromonas sp.]|nr:hypothetical protein [Dechloromonas sp.]